MKKTFVTMSLLIGLFMAAAGVNATEPHFRTVTGYEASTGQLEINGDVFLVTDQTEIRTVRGESASLRVGDRVAVVKQTRVAGEARPLAIEIWVQQDR